MSEPLSIKQIDPNWDFDREAQEVLNRMQLLWQRAESGRAASEMKTAMQYVRQAKATEFAWSSGLMAR